MNAANPSPHQPAEATPVQTGVFAVAAGGLRQLSAFNLFPLNFAPIGGLAIFSGARVSAWVAYALPVAIMIVTDLVLTATLGVLYSPLHLSRPFVYGSFVLYVALGRWLARSGSMRGLAAASVLGSLQFYLITNFGSWLTNPAYPRDLTGILECYVAGLPFYQDNVLGFFGFTLLSDLFFTFGFVALHNVWLKAGVPQAEPSEVANP